VRAHGRDHDAPAVRLHDGPPRRHGVGGGACGRGDNDPVPHDPLDHHLVGQYLHLRHPGHGALGKDHIVQGQVLADLFLPPKQPDVQHHPLLRHKVPLGQGDQQGELRPLQLRHEAHAAHVHPQDGHPVEGGVPGGVKDGPIPAEADQQVRLRKLLLQLVEGRLTGQIQPLPLLGDTAPSPRRPSAGSGPPPARSEGPGPGRGWSLK
jgi:hypothetical protein